MLEPDLRSVRQVQRQQFRMCRGTGKHDLVRTRATLGDVLLQVALARIGFGQLDPVRVEGETSCPAHTVYVRGRLFPGRAQQSGEWARGAIEIGDEEASPRQCRWRREDAQWRRRPGRADPGA